MRGKVVLWAWLFGVGCGAQAVELTAPAYPPTVRSALVVFEYAARIEVWSFALSDATPVLLQTESAPDRIDVLYYQEPLALLGLAEGLLSLAGSGSCAEVPLPPPFLRYGVDLAEAEPELRPQSGLSGGLVGLVLDGLCPCRSFGMERIALDDRSSVRRLVQLKDGGALVINEDGTLRAVRPDGTVGPRVQTPEPIAEGTEDGEGRLWLAALGGALYVADGLDNLQPVTLSAADIRVTRLVASRGTAPFELFTIGNAGPVERYDGQAWTELVPAPSGSLSSSLPAALWLGPQRLLASADHGAGLYLYDEAASPKVAFTEWPLTSGPIDQLFSTEAMGVLMLTRANQIFQTTDFQSWGLLPRFEGNPQIQVRSLASFGNGFLQLGEQDLVQYSPVIGYCPPISLGFDLVPKAIVPAGDHWLIAGALSPEAEAAGQSAYFLWVQPEAR